MYTRSVGKDGMARAVFEQPPVLDVILRNIRYENELLTERDMVSLRLVFKTPAAVDVIEAHRVRLRQRCFRKRAFVAQITELLDTAGADGNKKHAHIFNFLDALVENKDEMYGTQFFEKMCDYIRIMIGIRNNTSHNDPVFRMRVAAYRTKLNF